MTTGNRVNAARDHRLIKDWCSASSEYQWQSPFFSIIRCHKPVKLMKESEVMKKLGCTLCSSPPAFNLLRRSCLILTSVLLQVQLFWSLRLGRSQPQYSSILHRGRKHRLAPSNFDKYQWVDTGERKWVCTCWSCTPSFQRASVQNEGGKWREKDFCVHFENELLNDVPWHLLV